MSQHADLPPLPTKKSEDAKNPRDSRSAHRVGSSSAAVASGEVSTTVIPFFAPAGAFEELANMIPQRKRHRYSTPAKLGDFLSTKTWKSRDLGCYLLVTNVSEKDEGAIDGLLQGLELDYTTRLTYEYSMESLIIKCMLSASHEATSRCFIQI